MSECINALSDDIFALLFGHFSLSELLACRLICRRWNSAVHQICSLRESAKLFTSANDVLHYGEEVLLHQVKDRKTAASLGTDLEYWALKPPGRDDHLILNDCQLTPEFCQFFARLFPNVKHLIVYLNDDDDHHHQLLKNLPTLLQYYSVRLESLSLCGHVSRLQSSSTHHFLPFINSCLPQLKRLDLLTRNLSLLLFNNGLYSLAQVLSQLKHFSVNGKAVSNSDQCFPLSSTSNHRSGLHLDIAPVFEFLSESCTSLILKDVNFTAAHLADIYDALSTNPRLVTSVTHISLTGDLSLAVVKFICTNFRYLTKLQLEFASTETLLSLRTDGI
ncbi:hypothetical protein TYRP_012031 [Tyrophagus putrescentiae]|nr:hypothetical protein TYRP_012031 [Tyrophagus putrescentiae]